MKPTTTPGKASGSVMQRDQQAAPGEAVALQEDPGHERDREGGHVTPADRATVETRLRK